jgi:hypothetical protein
MQRRAHRSATTPWRHDRTGQAKPRATYTASLLLLAARTGQEKHDCTTPHHHGEAASAGSTPTKEDQARRGAVLCFRSSRSDLKQRAHYEKTSKPRLQSSTPPLHSTALDLHRRRERLWFGPALSTVLDGTVVKREGRGSIIHPNKFYVVTTL